MPSFVLSSHMLQRSIMQDTRGEIVQMMARYGPSPELNPPSLARHSLVSVHEICDNLYECAKILQSGCHKGFAESVAFTLSTTCDLAIECLAIGDVAIECLGEENLRPIIPSPTFPLPFHTFLFFGWSLLETQMFRDFRMWILHLLFFQTRSLFRACGKSALFFIDPRFGL